MRIPSAYFDGGLGQRIAPVPQAARADASGAVAIGQAGERLGGTILNVATDANEFQGRQDLQAAYEMKQTTERLQRDQEAELKLQAKEAEVQTANAAYFKFGPTLVDIQNQIIADENVHQDEYPAKMRELGLKHAEENLYPNLNEHQKYLLQPHLLAELNKQSDEIFKIGKTEIQDIAKAENLSTLEALKNDPRRSARTKIDTINDDNFFTGTGLSLSEITTIRQKNIQEIIKEDVDAGINSTKQDLKSLRVFKESITAKTATGNFAYMPEMDLAERNTAVRMVMAKEEDLIKQAQQRQRENQAAARQEATNRMMEYKDLVQTGWRPNTAADLRYMEETRKYASLSPSLSRQFETTNLLMTDMGKRAELMKKDPVGVAAAEKGVVLQPFNIMDVATLPQQAAQRKATLIKLGIADKGFLLGSEIKPISEYLQTLPPRQQTQYINTLSKAFGPVMSKITFNSAAEQVRQERPDQAVMFKLFASGKPAEALTYAEGRAYLTGEKKDLLKDKFTVVQSEIGERLKKTLGNAFASLPNTRNTISEAIATVYLGEAQKRNVSLDKIDSDLLADVTRRVAGDTVSTGSYYGSNKTTIVPPGMKPDQFLNSIKAITAADIAKRGGVDGMTDAEAAAYIKKVAWHEGNGGYDFVKDGRKLYGKNGQPFTFAW